MALNLSGLGAFLGGLAPQLNAMEAQRQARLKQQQQVQALLAGLQGQQGNGQPPQGNSSQPQPMPQMGGQASAPSGGLPSGMTNGMPQPGQPPSAAMGGGGTLAAPGMASGMPQNDPASQGQAAMIRILLSPGDPEAKLAALDSYSKNVDPLTKMSTQLEMRAQQIDAQERGQDITSADKAKNISSQYDKMNGVDLRGELSSITQQLTNNPKLTSDERKDLQAQWQAAKIALDNKRKAQGLPADRAKPPTPNEQVRAAAGSDAPLVTTKEEFDKLPSGATYKESDGNTYTKP